MHKGTYLRHAHKIITYLLKCQDVNVEPQIKAILPILKNMLRVRGIDTDMSKYYHQMCTAHAREFNNIVWSVSFPSTCRVLSQQQHLVIECSKGKKNKGLDTLKNKIVKYNEFYTLFPLQGDFRNTFAQVIVFFTQLPLLCQSLGAIGTKHDDTIGIIVAEDLYALMFSADTLTIYYSKPQAKADIRAAVAEWCSRHEITQDERPIRAASGFEFHRSLETNIYSRIHAHTALVAAAMAQEIIYRKEQFLPYNPHTFAVWLEEKVAEVSAWNQQILHEAIIGEL